jgi:hypothetical protein
MLICSLLHTFASLGLCQRYSFGQDIDSCCLVLRPCNVVLYLHRAVGRVCSCLYEGILHNYLRCPRLRANPENVLVVCIPNKLAPVALVEGQESCIPTVHGYMVQLQDPYNGVKSVTGSPIPVPVACDVPVLGRVIKYF